jgi:hypothetical protein
MTVPLFEDMAADRVQQMAARLPDDRRPTSSQCRMAVGLVEAALHLTSDGRERLAADLIDIAECIVRADSYAWSRRLLELPDRPVYDARPVDPD